MIGQQPQHVSPEVQRYIREEIRRAVTTILSGNAGTNDVETETINNMYPGMPAITKRPVMHPFGFASRAPQKTIAVVGKQGNSPENRLVLGHRDARRPTDLGEGDSAIYSSDGKTVLAFIKVLKDELTFSTGSGNGIVGKFSKDGKITAANQTGELIAIISDLLASIDQLFQGVATGTVTTIIGEEPLKMAQFPTNIVQYEQAKAKFDTFKAEA